MATVAHGRRRRQRRARNNNWHQHSEDASSGAGTPLVSPRGFRQTIVELLAQLSDPTRCTAAIGCVYCPSALTRGERSELALLRSYARFTSPTNAPVPSFPPPAAPPPSIRRHGRLLFFVSRWDACVAAARSNFAHFAGPRLIRPSDAHIEAIDLRDALSLSASEPGSAFVPRSADLRAASRLARKRRRSHSGSSSTYSFASDSAASAFERLNCTRHLPLPLFAPLGLLVNVGSEVDSEGNQKPRTWRPLLMSRSQLNAVCEQMLCVNAENATNSRRLQRAGRALATLRRLRSQWQSSGLSGDDPFAGLDGAQGGNDEAWSSRDEFSDENGEDEALGQQEESELAKELLGEDDDGLGGLAASNDTGPLPGSNIGGRLGLAVSACSALASLLGLFVANYMERIAIRTPPGRSMLGTDQPWPGFDQYTFVTTLDECLPKQTADTLPKMTTERNPEWKGSNDDSDDTASHVAQLELSSSHVDASAPADAEIPLEDNEGNEDDAREDGPNQDRRDQIANEVVSQAVESNVALDMPSTLVSDSAEQHPNAVIRNLIVADIQIGTLF